MRLPFPFLATLVAYGTQATDSCALRDPILQACISERSDEAPSHNSSDKQLPPTTVIRRGPFGGVLGVPPGYYVCAHYDFKAKRCLVRAPTEEEMQSATDLGITLTQQMQQRQQAVLQRAYGFPSQMDMNIQAEPIPLPAVGIDEAVSQPASPAAASFEKCVAEKMAGQPDDQLLRVLEECDT